jgi:7-cyano-7-deazaguanine synthase
MMGITESLKNEGALVLASGGQDSTTCLFWAVKEFARVDAVSFFYNQKHAPEIDAAKNICAQFSIQHKVVDISFLKDIVISNLFAGGGNVNESHAFGGNVPSSFVPYRNLIFLTLASAWASTIGIRHIVTGVCETDYSGYPDCRDVFIKSTQATLNLALDIEEKNVIIHTPLMRRDKAAIFELARELGCLEIVIQKTVTCYEGDTTMNPFGRGCGVCPACVLRKKGYEEFLQKYEKM